MKIVTLVILNLLLVTSLWSQSKNEREQRVELQEFPEAAIAIIEQLPSNVKRIKLYKEQDGDKQSFEAKFKYKKQNYSLEFDTNGIIEDLEVTLKIKKVEGKTASKIEAYFNKNYSKSKLIKVQQQYLFHSTLDSRTFVETIFNKKSTAKINYEIIAEVTKDGKRNIKEFTFDNDGGFLNFRIVNPSSYEHVLY